MISFPTFMDLFAGAGGLSEGFIRAGFEPVAHVEMDKNAANTLRTRTAFHYLKENDKLEIYLSYLRKDINRAELWSNVPGELMNSVVNKPIAPDTIEEIFKKIDKQLTDRQVDVIVGGPPCQAYSLVGRGRDPKGMKGDSRNYLYKYYAEFLRRYQPHYFVFENVLGLLSAGNRKYLRDMLSLFHQLGYTAHLKVLSADHYGVLQTRKRVIIIGKKGEEPFDFPKLETVENRWSVKQHLFCDLPALRPGQEMHIAEYTTPEVNEYLRISGIRNGVGFVSQHITRPHNERDLMIYQRAIEQLLDHKRRLKYSELPEILQTHKNKKDFLDRFKVVNPTGCSHTVVAHLSQDGHYFIYPDRDQVRSISVREAARIQSFPDDYFFEGGRTPAFKQIGNAVPPLLAEKIANKLKSMLNGNPGENTLQASGTSDPATR